MTDSLILAIDQGTSSTKVLLVDRQGQVRARGWAPLSQQAPQPGWIEHRPLDVIESARTAVDEALSGGDDLDVVAVGISNQRESLMLWDRSTGAPVSPLLSWQDRRTTSLCEELLAKGHGQKVRSLSGLPLDPMFSAVKATWLLDACDPDRVRGEELCLGTVDSWLVWHLTGDHVIEAGNASRTALVDLATGEWSPTLLEIFGVPEAVLPRIVDSSECVGVIRGWKDLDGAPVHGILGDSHAALFAHAGWRPGVAKATYGTGSSVMTLTTEDSSDSPALCRTVAWQLPGQAPALAWEANILSAGSTVSWLAEMLATSASDLAEVAASSSAGVVLVPAFNGLGAPWWDGGATALITGVSLGTTSAHLARAALDSVVLQVDDVLTALAQVDAKPQTLFVDGGMAINQELMSRQAAVSDVDVAVSMTPELSALGAAHMAGLGAGWWTLADLESLPREYTKVAPADSCVDPPDAWVQLREDWLRAVARARSVPSPASVAFPDHERPFTSGEDASR